MLATIIDALNATWPWLILGASFIFNLYVAYNFRQFPFLPWTARIDPILSMLVSNTILLIHIFEPIWVTRETMLFLLSLLTLSCLHFAEWQARIAAFNGQTWGVKLYLSELKSVLWLHAAGFGVVFLFITFPPSAT